MKSIISLYVESVAMSGNLQTVGHAVQLMQLLTRRGPMGVTAIAEEMRVSTSSTHRILHTLVAEGVVVRRPNGRAYNLVEGVSVAPTDRELERVLQVAPPTMEKLRDITEETVHIAVLSGELIVYAASVESHQMMRVASRVGDKAPAHLSAAGKVLLAQRPDYKLQQWYEADALERRTPHSLGSGPELWEELGKVRRNGYARNLSESEIGLYALAVPIFSTTGQAVCSLTVSGPSIRIGHETGECFSPREEELLHHLRSGAQQLEASLL